MSHRPAQAYPEGTKLKAVKLLRTFEGCAAGQVVGFEVGVADRLLMNGDAEAAPDPLDVEGSAAPLAKVKRLPPIAEYVAAGYQADGYNDFIERENRAAIAGSYKVEVRPPTHDEQTAASLLEPRDEVKADTAPTPPTSPLDSKRETVPADARPPMDVPSPVDAATPDDVVEDAAKSSKPVKPAVKPATKHGHGHR